MFTYITENLVTESSTREDSLAAELEALMQKVRQSDGQCQTLQKREEELKMVAEKEMVTDL